MVYFKNISPQTWEHPSDKAALNALKAIKGFDQVLKYVMSVTNERQEKLKLLSTCVKASEKNYPKLYEIIKFITKVFDWDFTPDIFIDHGGGLVHTGGVKEPYIVISEGCLEAADEEIILITGREMGHIMSGHVLYNSMMNIVVNLTVSKIPSAGEEVVNEISLRNIPFFGPFIGLTLKPLKLALAAWHRKSELTADRAGLLALQDVEACHRLQLKHAGFDTNIDLDDLYKQALEYESYNSTLDNLYKINNYGNNPDSVIRIKELEAWVSSRKYQEILDGTYLQRDTVVNKVISNETGSFCGNCGKKILEVKFCPFCGRKV